MGVKFTAIRLSPEVLARIDALAGKGQRSEFIRRATLFALDNPEAVERELARREGGGE